MDETSDSGSDSTATATKDKGVQIVRMDTDDISVSRMCKLIQQQ